MISGVSMRTRKVSVLRRMAWKSDSSLATYSRKVWKVREMNSSTVRALARSSCSRGRMRSALSSWIAWNTSSFDLK